MIRPEAEFIVSTEQECLTAVEGTDEPAAVMAATMRFVEIMRGLAPSVPCPAGGLYNGYGRIYVDCGLHLEFAAIECCNPYSLALIVGRQHELASRAVAKMADEGISFVLANNNHSGVLRSGSPTWGAHENYLVERHPTEFAELILPFLVSRIYGGAGGIQCPGAHFVAAVRPEFMELAAGGETTECRAIHSTSRDENHMGPGGDRYRYHLILGDGHRSHFNLALQFGATALALKAIFFDPELRRDLAKLDTLPLKGCWVKTLRELSLLARPGEAPRVHPLVVEIQRVYLAAARRFAESLESDAPPWVPRLLADWARTLDALERGERAWLSARLDAFAKYELYSAVLEEAGCDWKGLRRKRKLFYELALLDQSYHEFCNPASVFDRLEATGLLEHRVGDRVSPGDEPEPYIPETSTRARARARFIVENADREQVMMDWSWVRDRGTRRLLSDPFATAYSPRP